MEFDWMDGWRSKKHLNKFKINHSLNKGRILPNIDSVK